MRRVLILQERIPHYRVAFFERLRAELASDNVRLDVAHGGITQVGTLRADEVELPWSLTLPIRRIQIRGRDLIWQRVGSLASRYDLVILPHQTRYLSGWATMLRRKVARRRVALWGMTRNYTAEGANGSWKIADLGLRLMNHLADWYFSYTEGSNRELLAEGFPECRTTVVQNALDTVPLTRTIRQWRKLTPRQPGTCVFLGSLHADKRLDFLIAAADIAREHRPDFRLLVVGDGPLAADIQRVASERDWIEYRGAQRGDGKVEALALSQLFLAPGQVGLGVLDALAAQTPPVLCAVPYRGPEAEYAVHDENALVLPELTTPQQYAMAITQLLADTDRLESLQRHSAETASQVTLEDMTSRFAVGVRKALVAPVRRARG